MLVGRNKVLIGEDVGSPLQVYVNKLIDSSNGTLISSICHQNVTIRKKNRRKDGKSGEELCEEEGLIREGDYVHFPARLQFV